MCSSAARPAAIMWPGMDTGDDDWKEHNTVQKCGLISADVLNEMCFPEVKMYTYHMIIECYILTDCWLDFGVKGQGHSRQ